MAKAEYTPGSLPYEAPSFRAASPADEGAGLTLTLEGRAGDRVWVVRGEGPGYVPTLASRGVLLLDPLGLSHPVFAGVIPPSGLLNASIPVSKLPVGEAGGLWFLQSIFDDPTPGLRLGPCATPAVIGL
jgi:hypothetical protein